MQPPGMRGCVADHVRIGADQCNSFTPNGVEDGREVGVDGLLGEPIAAVAARRAAASTVVPHGASESVEALCDVHEPGLLAQQVDELGSRGLGDDVDVAGAADRYAK